MVYDIDRLNECLRRAGLAECDPYHSPNTGRPDFLGTSLELAERHYGLETIDGRFGGHRLYAGARITVIEQFQRDSGLIV